MTRKSRTTLLQKQINILEGDFREDVIFNDMSRETAIDVYAQKVTCIDLKKIITIL